MIRYPNKNMSVVENQIVERLVNDILAAGCNITVWNGGDDAELEDCTDPERIFAELAASDQDELTVDCPRTGYKGWIRLVYGNDHAVISDYTTRLEDVVAGAERLADDLENGVEPLTPSKRYSQEDLDLIGRHYNLFVRQDNDGNVVGNTDRNAESGWRPIYWPDCEEAIAIERNT
jgi:hypothetical protein